MTSYLKEKPLRRKVPDLADTVEVESIGTLTTQYTKRMRLDPC